MNFKEKMSKQNNSVKVLLRKLKRHDTVVVAIAVAIALLLSGGLIYLSTPAVAASAKEELEQSEKENNEKTIEKLDELSSYLEGLDESLEESQKSISSFNANNTGKGTDTVTSEVNEKVAGLGKDMSTLHTSISSTQTNIEKIKESIEKGTEMSSQERSESLAKIDRELDGIKDQYNKTQENTKSLIEEIQKQIKSGDEEISSEMNSQYKDLLDKLGALDSQFTKENAQTIDNFKTEINGLNTEIQNLFQKLDNNMNEVNVNIENKMDSNMTEFITHVDNKFDQVFTSVSEGKELLASTLLTYNVSIEKDAKFENFADAIRAIGDLKAASESVIENAMNDAQPEKIMAGQTITIGETVIAGTATSDANATAADILSGKSAYVNGEKIDGAMVDRGSLNAVLTSNNSYIDIPEGYYHGGRISTDLQNVEGTIEYTYHHHTRGDDNQDSSEVSGSIDDDEKFDEPGGCFTTPYYHISYQEHVTGTCGASMDVQFTEGHWVCYCTEGHFQWHAGDSGKSDVWTGGHSAYATCRYPVDRYINHDYWTTDAGDNPGSRVGTVYIRSCGKADGQIVRALITY